MRLLTIVALLTALTAAVAAAAHADPGEDQGRNLDVVLRPTTAGPPDGLGKIRFRQPEDAQKMIFLETWVRLLPDRSYRLQRAVDTTLDGVCAGTNWMTLARADGSEAIETNDKGTGRAMLQRSVEALPTGSRFDIHFRVIDANGIVVLESGCYQYTVLP
jgi:hypothetical protein